jgi:hypothetical protein
VSLGVVVAGLLELACVIFLLADGLEEGGDSLRWRRAE